MSSPNAGGSRIPPSVQAETRRRILRHTERRYRGKYSRIEVSFRGQFCYIDAFQEPAKPSKRLLKGLRETEKQYLQRLRSAPIHLCRLRYFRLQMWSVAFYAYSKDRYEPSMFESGQLFGTPEEGLDVGAVYLS